MRKFIYIFVTAVLAISAVSCVKESFDNGSGLKDGESWVTFSFGSERNREVTTKSTVSERNECQIYNFYLFMFDRNGAKVTGEYFDSSNQKVSAQAVENSLSNCWYVSNATSDGDTTTGTVRIKTANGDGMKMYMITNLDADMVRISSDLLAHNIQKESDLQNFNVYLNQRIINRNGYFPMTGMIRGITVGKSGNGKDVEITALNETMTLRRIDAKVRFIFKTGNRPDENGQVISSFEAKQWKVVNVPRTAYLFGYEHRGISDVSGHDFVSVDPNTPSSEYSDYAKDFFDTDFVNFEDFPSSTRSEFSFYMLENRQTPKKSPSKYQDRSRSIKLADGKNAGCTVSYVLNGVPYERNMRLFEYANDFSTYVVVTGRVEMNLKNDSAGQVLGGDVQYMIHLGNWNAAIDNSDGNRGDGNDVYSGLDNFNTERNTSYTYTVTVNSVHNIRVEVETSQGDVSDVKENQPGATGAITIAKEEIMLCDCHYVSKTINFKLSNFFEGGKFDKDHCIIDRLTWSVKTPFGEGEPIKDGGMDITTGLDYKWVHFRLNKKDGNGNFLAQRRKFSARQFETSSVLRSASENKEGDGSDGLAGYHNDGVMDITELVNYIKTQVNRYTESPDASDFDNLDSPADSKLSFTVFVDEYYYEANPINNEKSSDLWKHFVNQEDRKLHILCSSDISKDEESRATGSVITIQQHAIQSIYNTDPDYTDLSTAWGVETEDEHEGFSTYWNYTYSERRYNDDDNNGLYNTCKEWGLSSGTGSSFNSGVKWGTYMDWEVDNSTPQFNSRYEYLRYSCMSRNRDNNGDGIIDRDEVRWYMASINQLIGIVVGKGLLNSKTQLYNRSPEAQQSSDDQVWFQHVMSSTSYTEYRNSNNPTMIWAEEGLSTSGTNESWQPIKKGTVRCVRNLGYVDGNDNETYSIDKMPQDYIQAEKLSNGNYIFTTTHLNSQALRYYTSRELTYSDELSIENRLYKKFEVYNSNSSVTYTGSSHKFSDYNRLVTESVAAGQGNPFCPEGYRTPSQVEMCVMRYYMGDDKPSRTVSRTKWSFGLEGDKKKDSIKEIKVGFMQNGRYNITVNNEDISEVRCVRDIRVN